MNEKQKKNQKMQTKKINKKKICIVLICIIVVIYASMLIRNTFSRYQSQASLDANVDIAFWLVSDTIQEQNIVFEDLAPDTTKECVFSVSNNNGTIRSNAAIEYKFIITATTNLPLTYALYEKTATGEKLCEVESEQLYKDDDGTYYREITVSGFELGCNEDETTQFALKATFPIENNDSNLSDLVECVNLKIDAKQKISE